MVIYSILLFTEEVSWCNAVTLEEMTKLKCKDFVEIIRKLNSSFVVFSLCFGFGVFDESSCR